MYLIEEKRELAPEVKLYKVKAPLIAKKFLAGQFVILRIDEKGERIPLTIVDTDADKGLVTLIFQEVGKSTKQLGELSAGDYIQDVIGPLGQPSHVKKYGTVVCVGGGIGVAPVYPIAKAMGKAGNKVISIMGARNKGLLILEEEMKEVSDKLYITTDDGSYGQKGFVTTEIQSLIDDGLKIDLVISIGPVVMMCAVCGVTKPHSIKTIVSLNPIMVDGTGMCGACRVTVGGETKFACVDGPEFDGHQVDFSELRNRQAIYLSEEKRAAEVYHDHHHHNHKCCSAEK